MNRTVEKIGIDPNLQRRIDAALGVRHGSHSPAQSIREKFAKAPLMVGERISIAACIKDPKERWKGFVNALDPMFNASEEVAAILSGRVLRIDADHSMRIGVDNVYDQNNNGGKEYEHTWDYIQQRLDEGSIWSNNKPNDEDD